MMMYWAIAALTVVAASLVFLVVWHSGRQRSDMGTLSERWMAEQRFRSYDRHR